MIDLSRYAAAFGRLPEGASAAEVNAERVAQTTLHIEDGGIARCDAFDRTKLYVRATAGRATAGRATAGRTGMAYTEKVDEDAADVIARALGNAAFSTARAPEPMRADGGEFVSVPHDPTTVDEMLRFGAAMESAARGVPGVGQVTGCSVRDSERSTRTVNSHGFDAGCASGYAQAELTVEAKRDGHPAVGAARVSARSLSEIDPEAVVRAAVQAAKRYDGGGLPRIRPASGAYDAVLTGQVMRNMLMTAWLSLSGALMRSGASPFRGEAGERIGSDAFSVVNAPNHPMLGQRFDVDAEGTRCRAARIVDHGRLVTPLLTLSTGALCGMPPTGSAGRVARMTGDVPIALTTVPANLYVEPGEGTAESLAERMRDGLLITYSLDLYHSVNAASGEFSVPCGGVLYRAGEPVGSVSQITMAGNIQTLWNAVEAVGCDLDFDEFYFQTYLVGSPSALARGVLFAM